MPVNEATIDAAKGDDDFHPGLGINEGIAGTIVGVYWLLMMVGRLLGGALGGILNSKQLLTGASALAIVLILLAIFSSTATTITMPGFNSETFTMTFSKVPVNILYLMLCGLCTSVMWAGIFNLATNGLGKYIAQGSGLFMTMVVGGGVLPLIQGKVADMSGYLSSYWVIIIGLAFLLYYALFGSKNVNKDIPVE